MGTEAQFRLHIGNFIFYSILGLFVLLIVLYVMVGLDDEEFIELLKIFTPIKAVYVTGLIKYVIANKKEIKIDRRRKQPSFSPLYRNVTKFMIYSHILSLFTVILGYALFNFVEWNVLKNLIIGIETFFGSYIGLLVTSLFPLSET